MNQKAVKLIPPLERNLVQQILESVMRPHYMDLCRTQNWCCKDVWPLVFVGPERSGSGLFAEYTANSKSTDLLKQYLTSKNVITLPKSILIEDSGNSVKALLSGALLRPSEDLFHIIETEDTYVVTRSSGGGGGDGSDGDGSSDNDDEDGDWFEEDSDKEEDDDDSECDEDVVSHAHQPQQQPFAAMGGFQNIQHLLPHYFDPGVDGEGMKKLDS